MIAENDLLFVVDGDNIFRSAQIYYGKEKRLSYVKLLKVLKKDRPEGLQYHLAIFVTLKEGKNTQMSFITRLSEMGFDIHTYLSTFDSQTNTVNRYDFTEEMIKYIQDFRCMGNYPKKVVVASAKGAFADLYTCLSYFGVSVEVMYVGNVISSKIQGIDKCISLGEEVLYVQGT